MTVADLIKIYEGQEYHNQLPTTEEKTYQWNQFVRYFNADPSLWEQGIWGLPTSLLSG